jgi:hypothetical protein
MKPHSLPAGTPVTIELRGKSTSEFVDGTIVGCDHGKVVVETFDGKIKRVDPDQVEADPVEPAEIDMFQEMIEDQNLPVVSPRWPAFPLAQPSSIA